MGVERLQLFVRFCNVCGLLPFRMILDPVSGRFKRFDSHWRHPANWWFLLQLIPYPILLSIAVYYAFTVFMTDKTESMTAVLSVAVMLYGFNVFALNSIHRLTLFRLRQLETAIEILDRVDRVLDKMIRIPCTNRRRTLITIGYCLFGVGPIFKKEIVFIIYNFVFLNKGCGLVCLNDRISFRLDADHERACYCIFICFFTPVFYTSCVASTRMAPLISFELL